MHGPQFLAEDSDSLVSRKPSTCLGPLCHHPPSVSSFAFGVAASSMVDNGPRVEQGPGTHGRHSLFSKSLYTLHTVMEEIIFGCIQGVLTSDSQPKEGVKDACVSTVPPVTFSDPSASPSRPHTLQECFTLRCSQVRALVLRVLKCTILLPQHQRP